MADMNEALSNSGPINQAAVTWLNVTKELPDPSASYLAQLAWWGLEKGGVQLPRPLSPSQPARHEVQELVEALLGQKPQDASQWFVQNPNLPQEEQMRNLASQLKAAVSPQEAAQIVIETAYDRLVAESATFQE